MKVTHSLHKYFLIGIFAISGCLVNPYPTPTIQVATQSNSTVTATLQTTSYSIQTNTLTPPSVTLEPAQITETLQPLLKEPMNCAVPCFWGIIPGKTSFDEARIFFNKLGFTPFEGKDPYSPSSGMYFYTISYDSSTGYDSSVTLHIKNNLVQDIMVTPNIPKPKEGSPREWIAYSPETLINRYGSPSRVQFTVSSYGLVGGPPPIISINMIMYFDTSGLIVHYSGRGMTPESFCPLTAPFDFVRLWIGPNPPETPSFETVPLEKATSLTIDQFSQLMKGDSKKACFEVNEDASP